MAAWATCLPSAEDCGQSFLVTVTIVNIANTELVVEPNQMDVFDSQGDRVRRAYPERPLRCRGPLFSPEMSLGLNEECTIDAVFAGSADPSRLAEMQVELKGIRRQGNVLPIIIVLQENECIHTK